MDLKTGALIGFESLARWEIEAGRFIAPDIFIPIAEKSNLITTLSKNLLAQGTQALKALFVDKAFTLAVNVSVKDICCKKFADEFINIITSQNFEPRQIEIEITESCLVNNFDVVSDNITALRKLGVKVAIDDFGTGFSSLSYLRKLSVDTLKLDRSFVQEVSRENTNDTIIIKSIIDMAHQLGLKVVAEGVETKIQSEILKELNCDYAQGYLFSRPLNIRDLNGYVGCDDSQ